MKKTVRDTNLYYVYKECRVSNHRRDLLLNY